MNLKMGTRPPWVGLGAAVWVQIASGNAYNFPLYSHSLKSVLNLNQRQLTMLGVANDIGENVGLLPGIACNKFPPWIVLAIGASCCFFGYGVLWLSLSRIVLSLPYWLVKTNNFFFVTLVSFYCFIWVLVRCIVLGQIKCNVLLFSKFCIHAMCCYLYLFWVIYSTRFNQCLWSDIDG